MSSGLIGKKLGMSAVYSPDGKYIPVTVIQAGPCIVTQIKTDTNDGYSALQLGFGDKKASRINKPVKGHLQKSGGKGFEILKEFRIEDPENYALGQAITLEMFKDIKLVEVEGISKGRGFAGVMKRHGFGGGRQTHGSKSKRIPGSIGCSAWPAKVIKGKKMPGHYGVEQFTIKNVTIVDIRHDQNLILVKGAVPGHKQGIVFLKSTNSKP